MSRDDFAYRDTGSGAPGAYGHRGRRNGLGIAALVLGLLAVLLSITLFGGLVLGVAAVVCGILGRRRARRGEASNGGMALAGLVLGGIGIVVPLALIAVGTKRAEQRRGPALLRVRHPGRGRPGRPPRVRRAVRPLAHRLTGRPGP